MSQDKYDLYYNEKKLDINKTFSAYKIGPNNILEFKNKI